MEHIWVHNKNPSLTELEPLIEFKAGLCEVKDGMLICLQKRGFVTLSIEPDQLLHLKWRLRTQDPKTCRGLNNLIILKGDVRFVRIKGCPDGRVYAFIWSSNNKRKYFWLQEINPVDDEDEESILQKVNAILDDPSGMLHHQQSRMMERFQDKVVDGDKKKISKDAFNSVLKSLGINPVAANPQSRRQPQVPREIDNLKLNDVLDRKVILELLSQDPMLCQAVVKYLPGEVRNLEEIKTHLHSPQFIQAVGMLDYAIKTGQVSPQTLGVSDGDLDDGGEGNEIDFLLGIASKPEKKIWTLKQLMLALQKHYSKKSSNVRNDDNGKGNDNDQDEMDTTDD